MFNKQADTYRRKQKNEREGGRNRKDSKRLPKMKSKVVCTMKR
jgi:hypothetical protein